MMLINATTPDLDESAYRNEKRWSVSQFKLLPSKPELFRGRYITGEYEFDPTAGMLFGTACHASFLEGKECHEIPADALTSNGQRRGKKWEEYEATADPLDCLNAKEMATVKGIRKSLNAQPRLANLLWGDGPTEHSIYAEDDETGLLLKGRLDKLRKTADGLILPDLKITGIDPDDGRKVSMQILEMGYHLQLSFYHDLIEAAYGERPTATLMIFCRDKPPYSARAWLFNDNDLDLGRRRNRKALIDLAERLRTGNWEGERHNRLNVGPDGMLLPKWAYTDDPSDNAPSVNYEEFAGFSEAFPESSS